MYMYGTYGLKGLENQALTILWFPDHFAIIIRGNFKINLRVTDEV